MIVEALPAANIHELQLKIFFKRAHGATTPKRAKEYANWVYQNHLHIRQELWRLKREQIVEFDFGFENIRLNPKEAVRRGHEFLESRFPGYWKKIRKPNVESPFDCLLCQVTGIRSFATASKSLGVYENAGNFGFRGDGKELEQAWLEKIDELS